MRDGVNIGSNIYFSDSIALCTLHGAINVLGID